MSETGRPTHAWVWRAATIGLLGTLIGMVIMSGADAGSGETKVLKPPKVVVEEGLLGGGDGTDENHTIDCPKKWKAIAGGIDFQSQDPDVSIPWNGPLVKNDNLIAAGEGTFGLGRKWRIRIENEGVSAYNYAVAAVCAKPVDVSK